MASSPFDLSESLNAVEVVSEMIRGMFQSEACKALETLKYQCCPWAESISAVTAGEDYEIAAFHEVDFLAHCQGDDLSPCISWPVEGGQVVYPPGKEENVAGAEAVSPPAPAKATHKYLLGAAHSGTEESSITAKVHQLETLLALAKQAFEETHGAGVEDISELVGAVVLLLDGTIIDAPPYKMSPASRAKMLKTGVATLQASMGTLLTRLAEVGRVYVQVVDKLAGQTFFYRGIEQVVAGKATVVDSDSEESESECLAGVASGK